MNVRVVLVDLNPRLVAAWRSTFEENPEVEIVQGSMLDQAVDAFVTPTNARGSMDGGLDAILKQHFGHSIQARVQSEIQRLPGRLLPVGVATCVPTGRDRPRFLISTPTMVQAVANISDTLNVALACAAAFQAVHLQNARAPGSIGSVALPGLGTNTGRVPAEICADLMWTAYNLFRETAFADFAAMRAALENQLGELEPRPAQRAAPTIAPVTPKDGTKTPAADTPSVKTSDVDFDDSE